MTPTALHALADAADALARLARAAADDTATGADLLPLPEAARAAATSVRVVREAVRSGALIAYGRQRDRSVRRADLLAWIESRRAPALRLAPEREERIERRLRRRQRAA